MFFFLFQFFLHRIEEREKRKKTRVQYTSLPYSIKARHILLPHTYSFIFILVTRSFYFVINEYLYLHINKMKKEIDIALDLLASYAQRFGSIKEESIEEFRTHLQQNLLERYQGHWYPGKINFLLSYILYDYYYI